MATKAGTEKQYRPCVGIVLFNDEGKVFVGERTDAPGAWQMPQGGIDPGETIEQAALREMKEETGTDKADIIRTAKQTVRYDIPEDISKKLWSGKYCGQEQTWVALRYTGQDEDIDLNTHDFVEFSEWQWASLDDLPNLIVSFKRDVYTQVVEMFRDIPQ